MSQNIVDFSGNPTGAGLMDDYLDKDQQNVLTSNSGIRRPSYAVAGTKWLDMSATPWLLKMYDGTNDIVIGTVNPSTHKFIASIPLTTTGDLIVQNKNGKPDRLASGTAGTVLTSNGIGKVPSWQKSPIDIKQDLTNPSADTIPSTKAVADESSRIMSVMDTGLAKKLNVNTTTVGETTDLRTPKLNVGNSSTVYISGYTINSEDNINGCLLAPMLKSNGIISNRLMARKKINGVNMYGGLEIGVKADGSLYTYLGRGQDDNSIVTTVSHGTNYMRFGNGLQICWGSVSTGEQKATFPQPFVNTNYSINITGNYTQTSSSAFTFQDKTTTTCKIHSSAAISTNWLAIGYWY